MRRTKILFSFDLLIFGKKIFFIVSQENITNIFNIICQANNTNIISASYHNNALKTLIPSVTDDRKESHRLQMNCSKVLNKRNIVEY